MTDIAALFEQPRYRMVSFLKEAGLGRFAARLGRLRDTIELADVRFDLDTRRREDTGITAPRGFERTVASMLRCGLRAPSP